MATTWQLYQDTGYEPIDTDHARISLGLGKLLDTVNAGQVPDAVLVLQTIAAEVAAHFAHEERLMAETGYALAARHKEAHDAFLADISKFLVELKAKGISDPFRRWATGRALEWFRFHIAANDVGLGRFLLDVETAKRQAVAPVEPGT